MRKTTNKPFTLLEIVLCVAILSLTCCTLGFQMHKIIKTFRFDRSVESFLIDLEKAKIIALADRTDLKLLIKKGEKGYEYKVDSDEPLSILKRKWVKLNGVEKILGVKKELIIPIYSQGRIVSEPLTFKQEKKQITLTFNPLGVKK